MGQIQSHQQGLAFEVTASGTCVPGKVREQERTAKNDKTTPGEPMQMQELWFVC